MILEGTIKKIVEKYAKPSTPKEFHIVIGAPNATNPDVRDVIKAFKEGGAICAVEDTDYSTVIFTGASFIEENDYVYLYFKSPVPWGNDETYEGFYSSEVGSRWGKREH